MKIPRIDTLLVKSKFKQTDRAMTIPSDLKKPIADKSLHGCTPDCDAKNERLNFLA